MTRSFSRTPISGKSKTIVSNAGSALGVTERSAGWRRHWRVSLGTGIGPREVSGSIARWRAAIDQRQHQKT